jgi:hypothetical protein
MADYLTKSGAGVITVKACGRGQHRLLVGVPDESTDRRNFDVAIVLSIPGVVPAAAPIVRRIREFDASEPEASERVASVPSLYALLELLDGEAVRVTARAPWTGHVGADDLPWFVQLVLVRRRRSE